MNLYLITNTKNGKMYIGITRRQIAERWAEHLEDARGTKSKRALAQAIRKYGEDAFKVVVLETAEDWPALCEAETFYITVVGTKVPNGYNMTDGGDGNKGMCAEALERMHAKCKNLRHTEEAKQRIGAAGKGRIVSAETRAKISAGHAGKTLTPEHRAKLAAAKLGKKRPPRSAEHSRKIAEGLVRAHQRRRDESKK